MLFGSAGWLFADLMLALVVMVFVATTVNARPSPPPPKPSVPPTPSRTTTPTPTTTAPPRGLAPQPLKLDINVNTDALLRNDRGGIDAMRSDMRAALGGPLAGRQVGVVLTFGTSPANKIQRGVTVAKQFNDQVLKAWGGQFAEAVYDGFFQGGDDLNKISLEIFVYNG
ncbi:hypothetical protein [Amycolatopsis sp. CA-126428]|uniref:hypothetical protein n=1 Tax=Amycolatopsis sp. CA-126428 TaxID=2073158 RepID=UPI000CD154A4|nr:hypothetical protein [Amycolatopsis sp. CA-126428]